MGEVRIPKTPSVFAKKTVLLRLKINLRKWLLVFLQGKQGRFYVGAGAPDSKAS